MTSESNTEAPERADDDEPTTNELLDQLEAAAERAEADFLDGKQFEDMEAFYEAMGNQRVQLTLDVRAAEASRALDALDVVTAGDQHPVDVVPALRFMIELLRALDAQVDQ